MRFRKLRIAWSAFWGVACVVVIFLWVRSYWRLQILEIPAGAQGVQISSVKGRIAVASLEPRATTGRPYLSVVAGDSADWRKKGGLGFASYHEGVVTALSAPYWVPTFLSAALAAAPWISQRYRFSLRTLLIAMTLVAVVLGLIVAVV